MFKPRGFKQIELQWKLKKLWQSKQIPNVKV